MRVELSELQVLCALAEEGSFKRAAERLHISQSAVSQSLAGLERKLDTALIDRKNRCALSEAGRRLYSHGRETLRQQGAVLEEIVRIRNGESGSLSVGCSSSLTRYHAPALLQLFLRRFPHCEIRFDELPSRQIITAVAEGRVELGLGPFQTRMEDFHAEALFRENRVLVIAKRHPLYSEVLAGESDALRQCVLITSALDDAQMRPAIERIRDRFAKIWQISSLRLRIKLVSEGKGLAYLDQKVMADPEFGSELTPVDALSFAHIERDVGVYYRRGRSLSLLARAFVEQCHDFWNSPL